MAEFCFDVDSLGTLTLKHFEQDCEERNESSSPTLSNGFSASPTPTIGSPHSHGSTSDGTSIVSNSSDDEVSEEELNQSSVRRVCSRQGKTVTSKRNERERRRVKLISNGFSTLRKRVFGPQNNNRLAKLHILRSAIEYIRSMEQLLAENDRRVAVENQSCDLMQEYRLNMKRYSPMMSAKKQETSPCCHWKAEMGNTKSYRRKDPGAVSQPVNHHFHACERREYTPYSNPNIAQ